MKFGKPIELAPVTLTDASTINTDASLGNVFDVTIAANRSMAAPTNPVNGKPIMYRVKHSGANRTITWNNGTGGFAFPNGFTLALSTVSGRLDIIGFQYNSAKSKWLFTGATIGL